MNGGGGQASAVLESTLLWFCQDFCSFSAFLEPLEDNLNEPTLDKHSHKLTFSFTDFRNSDESLQQMKLPNLFCLLPFFNLIF